MTSVKIISHIRRAQAAEYFRSTYAKSANSTVQISESDLNELVSSRFLRPSVLIDFWGVLGTAVGTASRFAPQPINKTIEKIVDDAVQQQFNDSIRDMHQLNNDVIDIDVKETIKFHRELKLSNENDEESMVLNNSMEQGIIDAASTGLKQMLLLSGKF
mmetsp:Transcript_20167/g.20268  ORF Transcript_20167/g.20268 Transcript_20167/m.20268 type:complete len:159 (+) Transcript_20167:266-742(+)